MASVLFLIETTSRNQFRYYYLRNKILLLNLSLYFWNLHYILNIFEKKMTLIADIFVKLRTPKKVIK